MKQTAGEADEAGPMRMPTAGARWDRLLPRGGAVDLLTSLSALIAVVAFLSLASPYFMTASNLANVSQQVAVLGIVAVGQTLVITSAGIDLSVGSVLALSATMLGSAIAGGVPVPLAIALASTTGAAAGWVNGNLIARLGVPPFIATLGMLSVARGLALVYSDGLSFSIGDPGFRQIATGSFLGIPNPSLIMLGFFAVGAYLLTQTRFGRSTTAIGGSQEAARLSGIRIGATKTIIYTFSGFCAGAASIVLSARLGSGQPIAGALLELDTIAAVVIGGTSLSGGRGNIFGTVIGVALIGVIRNGLNLLNVSAFWQPVAIGAVIIAAVAVDQFRRRG